MPIKYINVPFEKADIQDSGIFTGYGSTFGGKPDSYGDIIAPGAFTGSIAKNGRGGMGIAMLYQHDHTQPIGTWTSIAQDKKGLAVEGQLVMEVQQARETHALLKAGALKGLSIGFDLPRDENGKVDADAIEINEKKKTQLLKIIDLWEISPVTFAANTRARVTGVKNLEDAKTVRELEKSLRDSGLSKSEAVYLASLCRTGLRDSGEGEIEDLLKTLNTTVEEMKNYNLLTGLLNDLNFVSNKLKI